jgi:hypothetical protein
LRCFFNPLAWIIGKTKTMISKQHKLPYATDHDAGPTKHNFLELYGTIPLIMIQKSKVT